MYKRQVGLLLGFLIAKCGFNWLVEQGNLVSTGTGSMGVQNQQVPLFSLPVILLCIFVSFLTVALALRKPMKIVSRISPIEATRYLENAETQKKGKRNGRKNVTVFSMAMANVTGNPKRTIGTILTMGFSCVLFVIISTVGNGMIRLQKSQAAGSYGSNYGLFVAADGSQLKEVNRRAEIDATGTMCTEGIIKGNENGGFVCMDETARKMLPYNKEYELKEGKYPVGTQEIAAGRAFFSEM